MHVDHLTFVASPQGLQATVAELSEVLRRKFKDGGFHPRFGTRNNILPLSEGRYIEVVEVLDHPAAEKAVYGQAVRARQEMGGGWLGWVISVEDLSGYEQRLERKAVPGSRQFPDGRRLEWEQIGIKGLMADPQLPFFVEWTASTGEHPSTGGGAVALDRIEMCGDPDAISAWLGADHDVPLDGVTVDWVEAEDPGLVALWFSTPHGSVRID